MSGETEAAKGMGQVNRLWPEWLSRESEKREEKPAKTREEKKRGSRKTVWSVRPGIPLPGCGRLLPLSVENGLGALGFTPPAWPLPFSGSSRF